ncbi:MAG: hypothetical protein P8R36_05855 [Actinomycetota bacterium]|nr:hypothetical protein [Actinomycetota bacterium]
MGCTFLASACSKGVGEKSSVDSTIENVQFLRSGFADGLTMPSTLISGEPQRAPFFLYGSNGLPVVNGLPNELKGALTTPTGVSQRVTLLQYNEGIPTPYFLLEFEIPVNEKGICQLKANIQGTDQVVEFNVIGRGETDLIQLGESMRVIETPTFTDAGDFDPICTRYEPCPFHQINLVDALENQYPTVLLISTPGFCQSSICGPVLELLMEIPIDPDWNVIHAEVYTEPERITEVRNFQELLAPIINTYGMNFEPCLIVADGDGTVSARLDYTFDKKEIRETLNLLS